MAIAGFRRFILIYFSFHIHIVTQAVHALYYFLLYQTHLIAQIFIFKYYV